MGKQKLLLLGGNKTLIYEFFTQMYESFEMLSCSRRLDDIRGHLKYFEPDAMVFCLNNEARDDLAGLSRLKGTLREMRCPLILVGDGQNCDEFERIMPRMANHEIRRQRGMVSRQIEEQIIDYLKSAELARRKKEEEEKAAAEAERQASADAVEAALAAAAAAVKEAKAEIRQQEETRRKHILVVDDDTGMLKMMKEIIGKDYDVATAISGKVALKFLETRKTDIILLDYEMPVQSGVEVYEKILENPATKDIPVVFLTGVSDRERIGEVLAMKPRGYLLKPINTERLKNTIAEIIG